MPVARSSRRRASGRSRREPSSDRIEEDESTQQRNDDVDGDEDMVESRRASKVIKSEKRAKANGRREQQEDKVEEEQPQDQEIDEDAPIDVENFPNHPIDKKESQKLIGVAQDWKNIRKSIHMTSYNLVKDVASSMAEVTEGDAGVKAINELDILMKDLIDIEEEMISNEKTVEDLHQVIAKGIPVEDVIHRYEKQVKQRINEYRGKTTRQKYVKNDEYSSFRQRVWEVQNPDVGMPPLTEFIPREEGDLSDDEDDVEIGGVTQDFKCPLSLTTLVDPYTSKVCGHSFSKEAIMDFLKPNRNAKKKCPASGCNKEFSQNDLESDKDLAKRVKAVARRQQRQVIDSDDEEVIE